MRRSSYAWSVFALPISFVVSCVLGSVATGCAVSRGDGEPSELDRHEHPDGGPSAPGPKDTGPGGIDPGGPGGLDADPGSKPKLDPTKDNDGDGYLFADDCNDSDPLVNPGAFEVAGDSVDNDCNGKVDEVDSCDTGLAMTSGAGIDFAKSLGLCRQTTEGATGKARTWGVISATIETSDGKGAPMPMQYGIQGAWGTAVKPKHGGSMVVLSTGSARTPSQAGYFKPRSYDPSTTNSNAAPSGWPINSAGCPDPTDAMANDSVVLKLKLRVPTNAKSFSYDFDFYSSEYITFVCSQYNDSYVALLQTKVPLAAKNAGNISFDKKGDPVNVNSGFFEACTPGSKSGKSFACSLGRGDLAGTGYDLDDKEDGATGWLETKASVQPGEEITISYMIWNTGDHLLQSAVLLDNWRWAAEGTTSTGPTTDRPK